MKHIELLDCTLRDGGHITNSYFGENVIRAIITNLVQSKIDIVEVGFLQNCEYDINRAMYNSIAEARHTLVPKPEGIKYALMGQADLYDFEKLERCDGTVEVVRVSFHDYDIDEGFDAVRTAKEKGYKTFCNPINIMGYTDEELLTLVHRVNEIKPYGFSIVDTFGSMQKQDLMRIYHLIDHNLDKSIRIGIHLHENQSLSFSLAQNFIDINSPTRDICIDGSLYGMGRVPGNLCIELIMKYMNENLGTSYDVEPVYDAIDEYIVELKKKNPWGYSIAYALSAQHKVHRTYAEYLMSKGRLKTKQINQILSQIAPEHMTKFDKAYAESLYAAYQSHSIDDASAREELKAILKAHDNRVLVIAPGPSINENTGRIGQYIDELNPAVISANFIWDAASSDIAFFTNIRRFESFNSKECRGKRVISSNLMDAGYDYDIAVNYSDYAYFKDHIADNCILMLLRLLDGIGVTEVTFAGFDGFKDGDNFAIRGMERDADHTHDNELTREVLTSLQTRMNFSWITPSIFERR